MTALFIDTQIPDYDLFISCVKVNILNELKYYSSITRFGFVWDNTCMSGKRRLMPFGTTRYKNSAVFTTEFINFLELYPSTTPITIDLISCSLWSQIIDDIPEITQLFPHITINYSDKAVGNSPQGSWVLSSGIDIQDIYFNQTITQYSHVLGLPSDGALGSNFIYTDVSNVRTFTLTTDFTIDNTNTWALVDISYTDNVHQVIIDGSNKKITIEETNFNGLVFAGNEYIGNNKPTIIRNLFIKATVNINVALAKVIGNIRFENCHLELIGNINNDGGGICYNSDGLSSGLNIYLSDCTCRIFGKIGSRAGPLIGNISYNGNNNTYDITNCLSVVSDNNSLSGGLTLGSSSGAFVGSGISFEVNISNSYCLFNGSMSQGSGLIAGKFLGSDGQLTISKFYVVSNITFAFDGSNPANGGDYAYYLSSYFGGAIPTGFTIDNLNILNFGINLTNMYCEIGSLYPTLSGASTFTDYLTFAAAANTVSSRVGPEEYIITIDGTARTFYSFAANYIIDWGWNLTTDILKGVSLLSEFSISNQTIGTLPFTPTLPVILVGGGAISYSSNNLLVATVNSASGEITVISIGTATITAATAETDYYLPGTRSATFDVVRVPCLTADTLVLTPLGFIPITELQTGDQVITSDGQNKPIIRIYKSVVLGTTKTYPCIIPKDSIAPNYPSTDFWISQNHLIKYKNFWILPKTHFPIDTTYGPIIEYYHIKLPNYLTDHLVINNGVVVESLCNHPLDKTRNLRYSRENMKRHTQYKMKLSHKLNTNI